MLSIAILKNQSGVLLQSNITKALFGALLLFICAQISIPLKPIPVTLQTVGVMLLGLTFSRKAAVMAVTTYVGAGMMGLPVFTGYTGGIGLTIGYALGFIPCVFLMSTLQAKLNRYGWYGIVTNCLLGTLIIFVFGISWLIYFMDFSKAITVGLLPFILPGIMKALFLSTCLRAIKKPS